MSHDNVVRIYGLDDLSPRALTWHGHGLLAPLRSRALVATLSRRRPSDMSTARYTGHVSVGVFAWSLDGEHVISAKTGLGKVLLSNIRDESLIEAQAHPDSILAAHALPDGSRLVTVGRDGSVALWNGSGQLLRRVPGPNRPIRVLTMSAEGTWVAGADTSGAVWLWDVSSGRTPALNPHDGQTHKLAFSPDGRLLAAGDTLGEVWIWNLTSGEKQTQHRHQGKVTAIAFSPDGRSLASGSADGTWLQTLDKGTGQLLDSSLTGTLLFSADGKHLITADMLVGKIKRWDAKTGSLVNTLGGDGTFIRVSSLALSPEGERLAATTDDGSLRLWDLQSGECRVLLGHKTMATHVAFSPDGRHLASIDAAGIVLLWRDDLPLQPKALRAWLLRAASQ